MVHSGGSNPLSYMECASLEVAVWVCDLTPYVSMSHASWGISTSVSASYAKSCQCADHIQPDCCTQAWLFLSPWRLFCLCRILSWQERFPSLAFSWLSRGVLHRECWQVLSLWAHCYALPVFNSCQGLPLILQALNHIFCDIPLLLKLLFF